MSDDSKKTQHDSAPKKRPALRLIVTKNSTSSDDAKKLNNASASPASQIEKSRRAGSELLEKLNAYSDAIENQVNFILDL